MVSYFIRVTQAKNYHYGRRRAAGRTTVVSQRNLSPRTVKHMGNWVCAITLLAYLDTVQAAAVSARLKVSARVVSTCRILTSYSSASPSEAWAIPGFTRLHTSVLLTSNCSRNPGSASIMSIAIESSNASQPIVEIFSPGTQEDQSNKPGTIIHGSTNAEAKSIHWGLFPVDSRLVISIPDPHRTEDPLRAGGNDRTLKLVIDY